MTRTTCIITGASRGLGAHIAVELWRGGASLLLAGRNPDALERQRRLLAETAVEGQAVHVCPVDLALRGGPETILDHARRLWPKLNTLVNNAAVQGPIGPLWENDWQAWLDTLQVDLLAPAALCRLAVPWMKAAGGGTVVNLSGGGATGPRPNFSAYATAKAGLVRFSETLAREVEGFGIRVNCVSPGAIPTDMTEQIVEAGPRLAGPREHDQARRTRQQEPGTLDRAAALVAWLAGPQSAPLTGKLFSAVWDPWPRLAGHAHELGSSDVYTLRRIVPADRGFDWGEPS